MKRGTEYPPNPFNIFLILILLTLGSRFFSPGQLSQSGGYEDKKDLLPAEPQDQDPNIDEDTAKTFLPPPAQSSGESEDENASKDKVEDTGEPETAAQGQTPSNGIIAETQMASPPAILPTGKSAKTVNQAITWNLV